MASGNGRHEYSIANVPKVEKQSEKGSDCGETRGVQSFQPSQRKVAVVTVQRDSSKTPGSSFVSCWAILFGSLASRSPEGESLTSVKRGYHGGALGPLTQYYYATPRAQPHSFRVVYHANRLSSSLKSRAPTPPVESLHPIVTHYVWITPSAKRKN